LAAENKTLEKRKNKFIKIITNLLALHGGFFIVLINGCLVFLKHAN